MKQELEKQMDKLGVELAPVESQLADASIYEVEHKNKLQQALQQQGLLKSQLAEVEEQWLETQDALEALQIS